jgi:hypothetical protein
MPVKGRAPGRGKGRLVPRFGESAGAILLVLMLSGAALARSDSEQVISNHSGYRAEVILYENHRVVKDTWLNHGQSVTWSISAERIPRQVVVFLRNDGEYKRICSGTINITRPLRPVTIIGVSSKSECVFGR